VKLAVNALIGGDGVMVQEWQVWLTQ